MIHCKWNNIYVDESVHENLGFIATAFVCSNDDLQTLVKNALVAVGFSPGVDEFKSGEHMAGNLQMRELRSRLLHIAGSKTKIAISITAANRRWFLGADIIQCLEKIIGKNRLDTDNLNIFFDRGLFRSNEEGAHLAGQTEILASSRLFFEQDSKKVFGIQVADAVAHIVAQILREELIEEVKFVTLGQENSYPENTKAELGWTLLMSLRYAFFVRPAVVPSKAHEISPEVNPVVLSEGEDIVDKSIHPDLFGWGVFLGPGLQQEIFTTVKSVFDKIWLGCIH